MTKKKWDANWDKLNLETKIDRLRDRLNDVFEITEEKVRRAGQSADAALYVANYCR